MTRVSQLHVITGFALILLSSLLGPFLATDLTQAYVHSATPGRTWATTLQISAHAHSSQFGMLHIAVGLTSHWTRHPERLRWLQYAGLNLASFAMLVLLILRSQRLPQPGHDLLGFASGVCLSAGWASLISHLGGLILRSTRPGT